MRILEDPRGSRRSEPVAAVCVCRRHFTLEGCKVAAMDEEQKLAFFLEWYDPQSGLKKGYIMHYHGDDTVELVGGLSLGWLLL
jgi:hypothetical protein